MKPLARLVAIATGLALMMNTTPSWSQVPNAGEPVDLDTLDPIYSAYMKKVKQRIYSKWGYPYEAQAKGLQGKVVIEFHIARDGSLQFVGIKQSSGEEILDRFATIAVKLGQRYPPLPDALGRDVLPIVGSFVYTLRSPEK